MKNSGAKNKINDGIKPVNQNMSGGTGSGC
jgi:hypothetical protein